MTVQLAFPFISPSHLGGEAPTDTIIFLCHVPHKAPPFCLTQTHLISQEHWAQRYQSIKPYSHFHIRHIIVSLIHLLVCFLHPKLNTPL